MGEMSECLMFTQTFVLFHCPVRGNGQSHGGSPILIRMARSNRSQIMNKANTSIRMSSHSGIEAIHSWTDIEIEALSFGHRFDLLLRSSWDTGTRRGEALDREHGTFPDEHQLHNREETRGI